jgi:hypothetical protein
MKSLFLVTIVLLISFDASPQGNNNKKPRIVGQDQLVTNEDQGLTILMSHLDVV